MAAISLNNLSIKHKILGYFLGIVVGIVALVIGTSVLVESSTLLKLQINKAKNVGANLAAACVAPAKSGAQDQITQLFKKVKKNDTNILYIAFIDQNGKYLVSAEQDSKDIASLGAEFEKQALGVESLTVLRPKVGNHVFEIAVPVAGDSDKLGTLRIGYTTKYIASESGGVIFFTVLVGILALLIGSIVYFFLIQQNIVYPLGQMMILANRVAEGDLSQKDIKVKNMDEFGQLAEALTKMTDSLRDIVSRVRDTADKVANSLQEVSSTIQEMNSSTQEVSNAIVQVSRGADNQAKQIEGTFEIMEKSAVSLKQVVANAQSANTAVSQTTTRAESARNTANEAVDRIGKLTNAVLETTTVIQSLGKMSQQIGEITETITSIADQTNLLALNAAIEAARAGEAGRGFAVVAEEVRKLAEGAAEAVRKIGGLIKSIQTETSRAVSSIELSSKEVQGGKAQVAKIAEVLGEINKVAQEATTFVNQISTAGQERVAEIEHIVSSINEVATIAKEAATSVQAISSTSQEQTAAMQEISASAQELAHLAVDLKDLVGKFKF
ncbi:MAG: methyl-accepting chemotaxis protein [Candidatus Omnitrophica bacterium]|nr:methyl-accepting chemotaxis protein [Candidatus Omnitrophota bacterium]